MPVKMDTIGSYLFDVTEAGLATTKKGYPQASLRLVPVQKFVEDKAEIEHFQKQGLLQDGNPGWVDWSAFDEEIVGFFVLFNSADEFSKDTALLNYEQFQKAFGWDGAEFDSFTNGKFLKQRILGRVVEKKAYTNPETGKTVGGDGTLEVSWIDSKDASPTRQLKSVAADDVKALNAKLKGMGKPAAKPAAVAITKPVAPAASAPAQPTASIASGASAPSAPAPQAPAASAISAAPAPAAKPAPKRKTTRTAEPPPAVTSSLPEGAPAETTQADAWGYVCANKGTVEDAAVEEAWIAVTGAILGDRDEQSATGADWAAVRDGVLKKIAA